MEDYPLAKQARLIHEAEIVVATHGAGLANLVFARPGTRVIEIVPAGRFNYACYPKRTRFFGLAPSARVRRLSGPEASAARRARRRRGRTGRGGRRRSSTLLPRDVMQPTWHSLGHQLETSRMHPWTLWPENPIFIELGVRDADLALQSPRRRLHEVSRRERRRGTHRAAAGPASAGRRPAHLLESPQARAQQQRGRADSPRPAHAQPVEVRRGAACRLGRLAVRTESVASLVGLLGCLLHLVIKRFTLPRIVTFRTPQGKSRRMFASRIRRPKNCRRNSLHFIPHASASPACFAASTSAACAMPCCGGSSGCRRSSPVEDVDMLVADDSLADVLDILHAEPGIQPCDVYQRKRPGPLGVLRHALLSAARGEANSRRRRSAQRPLPGARTRATISTASPITPFTTKDRSRTSRAAILELTERVKSEHDFAGILGDMAKRLWIDVDISLRGLHSYLQKTGWGPSPEMLARLARAGKSNQVAQAARRRARAARPRSRARGVRAARGSGATRHDEPDREHDPRQRLRSSCHANALARGNRVRGRPHARRQLGSRPTVQSHRRSAGRGRRCYDHAPIPPNRRQRRKFPKRTNARIFAKETIRDTIIAELPPDERFNALHSSDHAAEAWHLIEVLAPELMDTIRAKLAEIHGDTPVARRAAPQPALRRAA